MVLINSSDIVNRLRSYYPGKRTPLLCAVYRSFARRIISESNEYEKGVRSEVFDINAEGSKEDYLTCIALSEQNGIVAIGSGNREGYLYFVKDRSAVKDVESGTRFMPIHKDILGSPIHSMDWSANKLLIGLNNGVTSLYNIEFNDDDLKDFTLIGQYVNSPSDIKICAPFYISNTHVKSAEFAPTCDNSASAEQRKNMFLSTTLNQISVWDQAYTSEPLHKIQTSESPLKCASWSPNEPQSMIVSGGYDRKLSIIDIRVNKNQNVVWSVDAAHDRPITDAKFNNFIPYWLASAGEDSIVNIWDIRASYRAPVAKIDGNVGIVTSIEWSGIRPENLATTASDGTMRFWSLYPENFPLWDSMARTSNYSHEDTLPIVVERDYNNTWCTKRQNYLNSEDASWTDVWEENEGTFEPKSTMLLAGSMGLGVWGRSEQGFIYKGETMIQPRGSSVKVKASRQRPSTYYSISEGGQLVTHTIRFDSASNLRYRHRFDPKDKFKLAAEIEDDIYCRRITNAYEKLEKMKAEISDDDHEESHRQEAVNFFEDCLKLRSPIKETDWSFGSIPNKLNDRPSRRQTNDEEMWEDAINTFKNELKYWSYRIPPGYNTRFNFPLDFSGPLIAESLTQTERIITELPSIVKESDAENSETADENLLNNGVGNLSDDLKQRDDINRDSITNNNDIYDETTKRKSIFDGKTMDTTPVIRRFELMDDDEMVKPTPIKDRRNMSHIPSIVTMQRDRFSSIKSNLATPPYSGPGTSEYNVHNTNPFETSSINFFDQSPSSISSQRIEDTPSSKNPFEETSTRAKVSTNPFETSSENHEDASKIENTFEPNHLEPNKVNQQALNGNPFEMEENDDRSIKSASELEGNSSRRQSWISHRLNLSMTVNTDGSRQDDASIKSEKKRSRFDVFRKLKKGSTSIRRNALHGPF